MHPAKQGEAIAMRLRAGDLSAVEAAIRYLEDDPWAFRTGYAKSAIMRRLRQVDRTDDQASRLRAVVLHHVDVGPRWDHREACSLARAVADTALLAELRTRLHGRDLQTAYRALLVLLRLHRPRLSEQDVARGRTVLVDWAGGEDRAWMTAATGGRVRRLWSPAWGAELVAAADARDGSPSSIGARLLLRTVPRLERRTRAAMRAGP